MNVFIVFGKKSRRRKRGFGVMFIYVEDVDFFMIVFKCYYIGCVFFLDLDIIFLICIRFLNVIKWFDLLIW